MKKLLILLPLVLLILVNLIGGYFGWFGQWHTGENLLLSDWFGLGIGSTPEGVMKTCPDFLLDKLIAREISPNYIGYYYISIRIIAVLFLISLMYILYKYSINIKTTQAKKENEVNL